MIPVILSGGSGSRLWPLSRKQFPKQFLALTGEHTLFQQTLERLVFEGMDTPIVVCNKDHRFIVNEQLSARNLETQRILMEPFGRNTAPAVALTAMMLVNEGRDELMLVLPADHVLEDQKALQRALALATVAAENGEMVLFGVPATKPETGYGYIKSTGDSLLPEGVSRVSHFVEKPDVKRATEYVASGGYYWNSGMFLFRASRFLEELKKHDPDIYDTCLLTLERSEQDNDTVTFDEATFACCPDNSIDYSVMEKTQRACVVPLTAGWSDVGCWSSLWEVNEKDVNGNVTKGDCGHSGQQELHDPRQRQTGVGDRSGKHRRGRNQRRHDDRPQRQGSGVKQMVNTLNEQGRSETQNHCEVYRPWGSYDSVDMGGRFQVKHISVKPGACLSLQMHHHRAEHWIVVSGTAEVTCDENVFLLCENQSTYIPIASVHRLRNPGKIPLEIIEVQSGSYLGEDDIERFEDIYGRSTPIERGVSVKTIAQ
jgi:mannose-1-phosphate guanylyltransferase/mannose-6-phosphate isomerase